ncbi:MAG TPA: hypothetical protein VK891_16075 [Euzebyales bacterium]|nr:hypothetical protein [Euzebyales bacterium]
MAERRSWQELSPRQRAGIGVLGIIQVTLLLAALRDLRRRSDDQINGSRRLWKAAVFINYIGPIAYFWKGRRTASA